jgi:hypothetical protein
VRTVDVNMCSALDVMLSKLLWVLEVLSQGEGGRCVLPHPCVFWVMSITALISGCTRPFRML